MPFQFHELRIAAKGDSKAEQTRNAILGAAARLFRDEGYDAATLRRIAKSARMEAGSVYYHFDSKDAILSEVLRLGVWHVMNAVQNSLNDARLSGKDFRQTLEIMVDTHLTYFLRESDFTSANIRNFARLPQSIRSRHEPLRHAYTSLWDQFLSEAQTAGDIRSDIVTVPLRQFVLGAMNWSVEWYDAKRYPVRMLSERLTKLLLDGMAAKRGLALSIPTSPRKTFVNLADMAGNKAARTRAHLLSAAARVFRQKGHKAATMRDIAEEAPIEAGSIYYHFDSKEQILDEVLDIGLQTLLRGVSETISQNDPFPDSRSKIAAAISTHLEYLFQVSEFASANIRIYGQLPKEVRARHWQLRDEYSKLWDGLLREAQEAGELRSDIKVVPLRQAMLGALNWTVEWFDPEKGNREDYYTLQELIAAFQKLLLDGLQYTPPEPQER